MSKWRSRKLFASLATVVFVILTDVLGFNLNSETYSTIIATVVTYLVGQSWIDKKSVENGKNTTEETPKPG